MRAVWFNVAVALAAAAMSGCTAMNESDAQPTPPPPSTTTSPTARVAQPDAETLVRDSFERWRAGTGGPFELLADDASWTIVGSSPLSKRYDGKEQFMAEVIRPFNARMDRPLRPTVRQVCANGDTVVVLFDAESRCTDGRPYRNTYAWFMRMRDGRAVDVTAFFDTRLFDEMWSRVAPR